MTPSKQRVLTIGLILIGILAAGFFGLRTLRAFREFRGHRPPPFPAANAEAAETDVELIRAWMTVPFIAKTYHIPPPLLFDALKIPRRGNEEKSLQMLNDEYYPEAPGIVLEMMKAAIRANQPLPTAPVPDTPVPPDTAVPPLTPALPVLP
jgi:hypothetical protein